MGNGQAEPGQDRPLAKPGHVGRSGNSSKLFLFDQGIQPLGSSGPARAGNTKRHGLAWIRQPGQVCRTGVARIRWSTDGPALNPDPA